MASARRARVLAVLPLENRRGSNDAHLAEGLTAILIDGIDSRELHVPSRSAVEAADPTARDPLEVGRDLGAEAIVTGSVAASASGGIVIELRVTGTGDGLVLFAEKLECTLSEVVKAAERASRSIARALLVQRKDASSSLDDTEAIELYLQGVQEYRKRWAGSATRSGACFRRALERAPDDPMILAAYALALARRVSVDGETELISEARAVSKRAMALARDRAEPHLAIAAVAMQLHDNVEAARALRIAIAIAPHNGDAHQMLGMLKMEVLSVEDGLAHLYTVLTLDPTYAHARWWIGRGHALLGDWARADAIFATPPDDPHGWNDYWINRGRGLLYDLTPARMARFQADFATSPPFVTKNAIAAALALFNGRRPATDELAPFAAAPSAAKRRKAFFATVLAEVAIASGDLDSAMEHIANADAAGFVDIVWMDACPLLAPVRARGDFSILRERVLARAASVKATLSGEEK
ncbi:MAG: hypothetical protein NVS3B10_23350 [Polyangiales bacterium]